MGPVATARSSADELASRSSRASMTPPSTGGWPSSTRSHPVVQPLHGDFYAGNVLDYSTAGGTASQLDEEALGQLLRERIRHELSYVFSAGL